MEKRDFMLLKPDIPVAVRDSGKADNRNSTFAPEFAPVSVKERRPVLEMPVTDAYIVCDHEG